jgi:glycosyltransferase involved in cell wall biosynthesis
VNRLREVVIDARWLRTGIGRYILTLLQDLKSKLPNTFLTCITMSDHAEAIAPLCDRMITMNCGIYSLTEQVCLPLVAREASLFCAPHYNIPLLREGPLVVTIHDLTHLLFPAYAKRLRARAYAEPMLRLACSRAARIVTPSHYTRRMLAERLGVDPEKVSVVPCAVGDTFRLQAKGEAAQQVREHHEIPTPYILFVGSTAPHKNLRTLLIAYRFLSAKYRDMPPLVLVLPQKCTDPTLLSLIATPGVHCLHAVNDDSLATLYAGALMTVVPSFEEGFGLPVIESMACCTPVVCSRAASLPEIAGDDAVYFDPASVDSLASAMEQLLYSEKLQQRLAVNGRARAAAYSIDRAAASYAAVLTSVLTA